MISPVLSLQGGRRALLVLSALALGFSVATAGLIGVTWWGMWGTLILPTLWIAILYGAITLVWHHTIYIPTNTVLMINHPTGIRLREGPGRILPPLPTFERHIVTMPLYELSSTFDIEHINTKALQDVKRIAVEIHYSVQHPHKVLSGLPNRSRRIAEMAATLTLSPEQAMRETGFWERLLDQQIQEETDNLLRAVVYECINRAVECSTERSMVATEVRQRLSRLVERWGIDIHSLEFGTVELEPYHIKNSKRQMAIKREIEDAERAAQMEAHKIATMGKAQADIQAHAIAGWIRAIQDQDVELSPEDIEQIVLNTLEEMNERNRQAALWSSLREPLRDINERLVV